MTTTTLLLTIIALLSFWVLALHRHRYVEEEGHRRHHELLSRIVDLNTEELVGFRKELRPPNPYYRGKLGNRLPR